MLNTHRHHSKAEELVGSFLDDQAAILREIQLVGGAIVMITIIALVLNEVYNAINISSGSSWYPVVTTLENTGVAAITLLIVGLLVIAAVALLRYFGTGGFGGGRGQVTVSTLFAPLTLPVKAGASAFSAGKMAQEKGFLAAAKELAEDDEAIMREIQVIGGGLIMILVMVMVIVEVTGAVDIGSGPFSAIETNLENTGVAALTLLVVGLLVIAAAALLRYFGAWGFGGR